MIVQHALRDMHRMHKFPNSKREQSLAPSRDRTCISLIDIPPHPRTRARTSTTFEWRTTSAEAEQRSTRRLGMIGALPLSYRRDISLGMACCLMGTAVAASS